jgi:hypothetical protein
VPVGVRLVGGYGWIVGRNEARRPSRCPDPDEAGRRRPRAGVRWRLCGQLSRPGAAARTRGGAGARGSRIGLRGRAGGQPVRRVTAAVAGARTPGVRPSAVVPVGHRVTGQRWVAGAATRRRPYRGPWCRADVSPRPGMAGGRPDRRDRRRPALRGLRHHQRRGHRHDGRGPAGRHVPRHAGSGQRGDRRSERRDQPPRTGFHQTRGHRSDGRDRIMRAGPCLRKDSRSCGCPARRARSGQGGAQRNGASGPGRADQGGYP